MLSVECSRSDYIQPPMPAAPAAGRQPVSAVLITRDCAGQLPPTLTALAFCEEIVVVDSGSADDTVAVAQRHGAHVVHEPWRGFGPQKQFAIEQATHDWVLCIDADEIVSDELRASVEQALEKPDFTAYEFPRCNRFLGRYLRHGEGYPDLSLRLFDRRRARWSDDLVHEKVITLDPVGRLGGDLLHHSEDNVAFYLDKQNRYTTLAAQGLVAEGGEVGAAKLLVSPLFRFLKFFLLRQGFRDGLPGLIHILIGCFNSFAKYAKAIELQRASRKG